MGVSLLLIGPMCNINNSRGAPILMPQSGEEVPMMWFIYLRLGLYGGGGNCGRAEAGILGR
jgi:hypothetical protein